MCNQIMQVCVNTPDVGALACFLRHEIVHYAEKSPNIFMSYNDIFALAKNSNLDLDPSEVVSLSISAVHVLCNPQIGVLELKYLFIDDYNDPIEISIDEVFEAHTSHSLENPYTGDLIYDYKKYVFPFFVCKITDGV
ncbi:hypothetical protein HGT71_14360 [Rosenbergiella epipactidis]|uniref:hypothetical protein n=1 Tax=Rosenbergiella epipactidis TaxID=1544694 RepID=UPI001BDB5B19|nr:hypothetical protein [Rosenbergiella epipactidis]MBT0719429.1 hypothetical protein [Rosenbergiella epipactidis]